MKKLFYHHFSWIALVVLLIFQFPLVTEEVMTWPRPIQFLVFGVLLICTIIAYVLKIRDPYNALETLKIQRHAMLRVLTDEIRLSYKNEHNIELNFYIARPWTKLLRTTSYNKGSFGRKTVEEVPCFLFAFQSPANHLHSKLYLDADEWVCGVAYQDEKFKGIDLQKLRLDGVDIYEEFLVRDINAGYFDHLEMAASMPLKRNSQKVQIIVAVESSSQNSPKLLSDPNMLERLKADLKIIGNIYIDLFMTGLL